jgi:hypothetical protein
MRDAQSTTFMAPRGTAKKVSRRTRRKQARGKVRSRRAVNGNAATSLVRLAAGAVSIGADQVKHRLGSLPKAGGPESPARQSRPRATADVTVGRILTGIAILSANRIAGAGSRAAHVGRRTGSVAGRLAQLPLVASLAGPPRRVYARYERLAREISEIGRVEELEGRRLLEALIRDTTRTSVMGIAESALKEVTHSPEVAALVRTESAGLATGTILEVRANSEQADDQLERRVRSWLRIRSGHTSADGRAPTAPATGAAAR